MRVCPRRFRPRLAAGHAAKAAACRGPAALRALGEAAHAPFARGGKAASCVGKAARGEAAYNLV